MRGPIAYFRDRLLRYMWDSVKDTPPKQRNDSSIMNFADEPVHVTISTSRGRWEFFQAVNLQSNILSHVQEGRSFEWRNKFDIPVMSFRDDDRTTGVSVMMMFVATEVGDRRAIEFWPKGDTNE